MRHRCADRDQLAECRGRVDAIHRQKAADIVGVDRGMLQTEVDQGLLETSRIASGDGIDCNERPGASGTPNEACGGAERVQILEGALAAYPMQVPGEIRQRRIEFGGACAFTLRGATSAKGHE